MILFLFYYSALLKKFDKIPSENLINTNNLNELLQEFDAVSQSKYSQLIKSFYPDLDKNIKDDEKIKIDVNKYNNFISALSKTIIGNELLLYMDPNLISIITDILNNDDSQLILGWSNAHKALIHTHKTWKPFINNYSNKLLQKKDIIGINAEDFGVLLSQLNIGNNNISENQIHYVRNLLYQLNFNYRFKCKCYTLLNYCSLISRIILVTSILMDPYSLIKYTICQKIVTKLLNEEINKWEINYNFKIFIGSTALTLFEIYHIDTKMAFCSLMRFSLNFKNLQQRNLSIDDKITSCSYLCAIALYSYYLISINDDLLTPIILNTPIVLELLISDLKNNVSNNKVNFVNMLELRIKEVFVNSDDNSEPLPVI